MATRMVSAPNRLKSTNERKQSRYIQANGRQREREGEATKGKERGIESHRTRVKEAHLLAYITIQLCPIVVVVAVLLSYLMGYGRLF